MAAPKLGKKVYIPVNEYPQYNFKQLFIGPGRAKQERIETETGAMIALRGRPYPPENGERLHVLVEAETEAALDSAASMVEKFLEDLIKDEKLLRYEPLIFRCKECGEEGHMHLDCPITIARYPPQLRNVLAFLGVSVPEPEVVVVEDEKDAARERQWMQMQAEMDEELAEEDNEGRLDLEEDDLVKLFEPFGEVMMCYILRDEYGSCGFVKFADKYQAENASSTMHRQRLDDGRKIVTAVGENPSKVVVRW